MCSCCWLQVRSALRGLKLSNEDVIAYEHSRKAKEGEVSAPWPIRWTYNFLCFSLDILYKNRPIQRSVVPPPQVHFSLPFSSLTNVHVSYQKSLHEPQSQRIVRDRRSGQVCPRRKPCSNCLQVSSYLAACSSHILYVMSHFCPSQQCGHHE